LCWADPDAPRVLVALGIFSASGKERGACSARISTAYYLHPLLSAAGAWQNRPTWYRIDSNLMRMARQ
jgi:hypothetical protein